MSFTAEVKDELSRVEGECGDCDYAKFSALMRICGTLSFQGGGAVSVRIATETGAVARTVLKLAHGLFDLRTQLTVRRSVLHKTRNYLIEMADAERLPDALDELGILVPGFGIARGVPWQILERECCQRAFLRGAFMASGFIADPRGDFQMEFVVSDEAYANDLIRLVERFDVSPKLSHRRGSYVVYLRSYGAMKRLLMAMGAYQSARAIDRVRSMKRERSKMIRANNADYANVIRAANAGADQRELIANVEREVGVKTLPKALQEFCYLRLRYPEESLAQLGEHCDPKVSKSGMYHRLLRLQAVLEEARQKGDAT